jgi:CRP/FNR family transcriptional regulator, cyclic AMP receptor protein
VAIAARSVTLPLIPGLAWRGLLRDAAAGHSRWFQAREVIMPRAGREGETEAFTGVVESGAVGITAPGRQGRRATLAVLGPDDLVAPGVVWAALPARWRTEAVALVPTRIRALSATCLRQAIATGGPLALSLVAALADQSARTERRLAGTLGEPLESRLLEILRDLARRFGHPARNGLRIWLPITQEDLGSMSGAARESVSRALRSLEGRGLVHRSGRSYVVGVPG